MTTPPSDRSQKQRVRDIFQKGIRSAKTIFHPGSTSRTSANRPRISTAAPHALSSRSPSPSLQGALEIPAIAEPGFQTASTPVPAEAHGGTTASNTQSTEKPNPLPQGKFKKAGRAAWEGLSISLQLLEKSSEIFPPLKSAVSEFNDSLHIVQAAAENRDDYEQLASELDALVRTLSQYASEFSAEDLSGSIGNISLAIEGQVKHIKKQQNHSKTRRILESPEDGTDVLQSYRHIESSFRQLQNNVSLRVLRNTREQLEMTIIQSMSPEEDARYNSGLSTIVKRRGCTPATREAVLAGLRDWIGDSNTAKVYWMSGMAGTGKTTIAYSLCKWLEDNKQLGASFFCSRVSASCRNTNRIVPTVACQLSRYSPSFRSKLFEILKADQGISKLNVVDQFDKLIAAPLLEVKNSIPGGVVIVVDALDECEDTHGVRLILATLLRFAPSLPVKFFVASRPEPVIQNNMLSSSGFPPTVLRLHDIEDSVVEEDIKKYLVEALGIMPSPPSQGQIGQLAKHAGKLFIYAATLVRYILPEAVPVNSRARLEAILTTGPRSDGDTRSAQKYKLLDELYSIILVAAFNESLEEAEIEVVRLVLWTVVCAKEPMTTSALASLLGFGEQEVLLAVQPLQSVLNVSDNGMISTLHASFPEYLLSMVRSRDLHCDEGLHSGLLTSRCFRVMKNQLRFNICDIRSSFAFDKDVPDLDQRITESISPVLFYACRFWSEHLQLSHFSKDIHVQLADFLSRRLLFWMEVLNLQRCIAMGASVLLRVQTWLHVSQSPIATPTQQWVVDAKEFVLRFISSTCTRSTPHIYLSALPFTSKSSWVYRQYWQHTQGLTNVKGTAITQNDYAALARWEADSKVLTVQFSLDGTRIVSGSIHGIIQIWDTLTGNLLVGPFQGNMDPVNAVAFAPDGTRVVSGDSSGSIRLWNALTGDFITGASEKHALSVTSVAYSPDGAQIVSGSEDGTIRLWDAQSGDLTVGPIQTRTLSINSVAFSPDGAHIVSGAVDPIIQVWDTSAGKLIIGNSEPDKDWANVIVSADIQTTRAPFKRHIVPVTSVAFSPDGVYIVSGSNDCSVILWDALTGDIVGEPLLGHIDFVTSASFSPSGTSIASSSYDKTVRLWDASTRKPVAVFQGHTEWVNAVAFSPDGTRLVSGSDDCTLRIWDTQATSPTAGPLRGQPPSISTDSKMPFGDKNIQLPITNLSEIAARRFKGPPVVAFALNDAQIIVVSSEMLDYTDLTGNPPNAFAMIFTAQVWDVRTGDLLSELIQQNIEFLPNNSAAPHEGSFPVPTPPNDSSPAFEPTPPSPGSDIVTLLSLDGTLVATLNAYEKQTTTQICDAKTGTLVFGPFELDSSFDNRVVRSSDRLLEAAASGNDIEVRDSRTGTPTIKLLKGHTEPVATMAVSFDGSRIVSSGADGNIRVWTVRTGSSDIPKSTQNESYPALVSSSPKATKNASGADHAAESPSQTQELINILSSDWDIGNDGWITTNNIPILWVPLDFANCMPRYPHHLVIGHHGSIVVDNWDILLGERWVECYSPT